MSLSFRNKVILAVDDSPGVLLMLAELLKDMATVLTADNVPQALAILETLTPDLLLLDQRMPLMTGSEIMALLESRGPLPPTVLLTGYIGDIRDEAKGSAVVCEKPLCAEKLMAAVRNSLKIGEEAA